MNGHCVRRDLAEQLAVTGVHIEPKFGLDIGRLMVHGEDPFLIRREDGFIQHFAGPCLIEIHLHGCDAFFGSFRQVYQGRERRARIDNSAVPLKPLRATSVSRSALGTRRRGSRRQLRQEAAPR